MKGTCAVLLAFLLFPFVLVRAAGDWRQASRNPDFLHRSVKQITDAMVHDIYSPPVASRIYAYTTMAGYEAAIWGNGQYVSLAGQLNGLSPLPLADPKQAYSPTVASVHAVLAVGKSLLISEGRIDGFYKKIMQELKALGIPQDVFRNSVARGQAVAAHILAWSAKDHYKETRTYPKFSVGDEEATWKPTPPAYMRAVEPHWSSIRTFLLDSARQFRPLPPTPFSTDKNSPFYREALAVLEAGKNLTQEQRDIANFWDCNPFRMNVKGHVMYASKKISPGGHWINITRLACRKAGADLERSAAAYASVSVVLADGFISCWEEKYRSNVVRPETYISQYIDGSWTPLLQTPPFPEYTSGHSVISAASSVMLAHLFGEGFSFADSTEIEFGLPVRHFASFRQAAEEAAISRFYGGIHYMPSIVNGLQEGYALGQFVTGKLRTVAQPATATALHKKD